MEISRGVFQVMAECSIEETTRKWYWPFKKNVAQRNDWFYLSSSGEGISSMVPLEYDSSPIQFMSAEFAVDWIKYIRTFYSAYPLQVMEVDEKVVTPVVD